MVGKVKFEARNQGAGRERARPGRAGRTLLIVLRALREQIVVLHRRSPAIAGMMRCAGA